MTIESKISGWSVSDLPFKLSSKDCKGTWENPLPLSDLDYFKEETATWLLKNYNWWKSTKDNKLYAVLEFDDIYKVFLLEHSEEYADVIKEFVDRFGENWLDYYLRFNH